MPAKLAPDARFRVGVERGQRLVEQEDSRPARKRTRERDALTLAARQEPRAFVGERGEAESLEQRVNAPLRPPNATFARTLRCGKSA